MGGKNPKNIQESFPEICEALKVEDVKNVQVKARYANKTKSPNSETYQLCQVLQDCKCPENVIIVKETLVKCQKDPPDRCEVVTCGIPPVPQCCTGKEELQNSMSYIYCKEVVKPYLNPSGKSADDLACEAVTMASQDFPTFQYCCSTGSVTEPLVVNPSVLKHPPPSHQSNPKPSAKPESPSSSSSLSGCVIGVVCGASRAVASGAQSCYNTVFGKKEEEMPPPPSPKKKC